MDESMLTPALVEVLKAHRRSIAERRDVLARLKNREFRMLDNNRDVTAEMEVKWEEHIKMLEDLVARHDPNGLTAD